jgi:hypothetical protein
MAGGGSSKLAWVRAAVPLALVLLGGCAGGIGDESSPVVHLHVNDSPPPSAVGHVKSNPVSDSLPAMAASRGNSNGANPPPWTCPPPQPSAAKVSSITFIGPCAFTHTLAMTCTKQGKLLEVAFVRDMDGGWAMQLKVDINPYNGPGTYKSATSRFEIAQDPSWVTWSARTMTIQIASDEHSGSIGQMTMAGYNQSSVAQPPEQVQGTFIC